jgi:hypothetical protein
LVERGDSEEHLRCPAFEADPPFDLAEPAFAFGLGDAGDQVVADVGKSCPLGRVRSKE